MLENNKKKIEFMWFSLPWCWSRWYSQNHQKYDEDERKERIKKSDWYVVAIVDIFFCFWKSEISTWKCAFTMMHIMMRNGCVERQRLEKKDIFEEIHHCLLFHQHQISETFVPSINFNLLGEKNLNVCLGIENFTEIQLWILWPDSEGFVKHSPCLTCI